eukprot:Unigene13020_Nuclearia_a/m.39490 Unigene13020_Nuclearia_a/g.39490  ORF Unigene13020_Nuclearia_a/g.39490 Unigene13020_Nuclearia_a/m.39490 type:complete len:325 (-) Unigene13020_Nuclearia_a:636-1610(-)
MQQRRITDLFTVVRHRRGGDEADPPRAATPAGASAGPAPAAKRPRLARDESRELLELQRLEVAPSPDIDIDDDDVVDPDTAAELDDFPSLDEETLALIDAVEAAATATEPAFARPDAFVLVQASDEPEAAAIDAWDADHVKLPCSRKNCFKDVHGRLKLKWDLIQSAIATEYRCPQDLQDAILVYNDTYTAEWSFAAMHHFFNEHVTADESRSFFRELLPKMVLLCLQLPELVRRPIPLLETGQARSITLSQAQIASLLANAFFCTFPRRNSVKPGTEYASYPSINFNQFAHAAPPHAPDGRCAGCLPGVAASARPRWPPSTAA